MKPKNSLRLFLALAGSSLLAVSSASAQLYWDSNGSTDGSGDTPTGTWGVDNFWNSDPTGGAAGAFQTTTLGTNDVIFSAGTDAVNPYTVGLNSDTQNARLVTFQGGTATLDDGTLSLGNLGGITVASSTVTGATISSNLTLSGVQTFNVAASRTLTLDTGTFTRNAGATLNVANTGTVNTTMTGLAAGSLVNGIIGPWATFASGASTRYATIDGSNNIVAYTGGTAAATAANVTDTTGAVNYDMAGGNATLGTGANINTLRYTGAGGTIAGALTTGGIMNVGGGQLIFSGSLSTATVGTVLDAANGNLRFTGGVNLSGNHLTLTGSGNYKFDETTSIITGAGGLTINGSGLVQLGSGGSVPAHNYSGDTTINGGARVMYSNNLSANSNIVLNGGILESYWSNAFSRTLGTGGTEIRIIGGESGFALNGATGQNVSLGASITWGTTNFNPSKLLLQNAASQGTSGLTFQSAIDLNGANRTIVAGAGVAGTASSTLSGVISNGTGTAGLIKEGAGLLNLSVANTYNGGTTVSAGTLSASTTASRLGSNTVGNDISVSAGARLLLTGSANVGNNQTITLNNTGGSLSVLGLGYVGLPSAPVTFGSSTGVLAINTTGYNTNLTSTLSGNSIFLGSTGTGTFSGGASTIAAGSGSLYRLGGGGGALTISAANALTGANAVQIGSTATNGTGTVVFSASQNFTNGVTVNTGSALTLGVSQGFSGGVAVGGTLNINSTQAFGGGVTLASSGQINVNNGVSGAAFGTGDLTINGGRIDAVTSSGTFTSTNNNNWNASWTMGRGTTGTGTWNNNGNILLGNNITVSSANNFTALNLGGVIDDGASSFGLTLNTSSATLSNANTYNGATSFSTLLNINNSGSGGTSSAIGTGTLNIAGGTIDNTSGSAVVLSTNNTFAITGNFAFTGTNDLSNGTGNFTINGTRTITVNGSKLTLGGNQTNANSGGIVKAGAGTLALLGSASVNTGANTINAGVLEVGVMANGGADSSLGRQTSAANTLAFGAAGATLRYVGSADVTTNRSFTLSSGAGGGATIESSGTGTLSFNNTVALAYGTNNQTRTLTLGGTNIGANTFGKVIANNGSGATSLTKSGTGRWVLNQDNSYTGATNVNGGTLEISGSGDINQTSAINVAAGATFVHNSSVALAVAPTLNGTGSDRATFSGSGTVNAAMTLNSLDDVLSPGNSPGIQSYGTSQTWSSFTYEWELNDWDDKVAGIGGNIDQIQVTGTLVLSGTEYALDILSLTTGNISGDVHNFAETSNVWTILTTTGGISNFDADDWDINAFGFTNNETGNWSLALGNSNQDLVLSYTAAIPEPGAALLGSLGFLLILRRRR